MHLSLGGEMISDRLTATKGRTRGFDYLRAILSLSIIGFHSLVTSYGQVLETQVWKSPWRLPLDLILPAFFALSGFLVTGSLLRTKTIHEFLTLRAVRLVPALFFEVLISAMILGPLLTRLPLDKYFLAPSFLHYWLNILGDIHFTLPGLFLDNPYPDIVNKQLWTIPIELKCYIAIVVASFLGITREGARWRILVIVGASVAFLTLTSSADTSPRMMYICFLAGIAIYLYRDRIPLNRWLLFGAFGLTFVCLTTSHLHYAASVPIAYATIYLGLTDPPKSPLSKLGDYSYGLYIYGYAVQQAYSHLFPDHRVWWMNILFSLPVALVLAIVSWHFVEEPALRHRARAVGAVDAAVGFVRRQWQPKARGA